MTRVLLASITLALLTIPATANAHYIPRAKAEHIWYSHFNSWCGLGSPWCTVRNVQLSCHASDRHMRQCLYEYREGKLDLFAPLGVAHRYCHMDGEMRHWTILYGARNCTGWS